MKHFLSSLVLLSLFICSVYSQDLETRSIFNNSISIMIPRNFQIMSKEMMKIKYPAENRPKLIFTDESGSTNIAFNVVENIGQNTDLQQYNASIIKSFKNLYPSAIWIDSGSLIINNKQIYFNELITPAVDTQIYNLMFYTIHNKAFIICTFNCTMKDKDKWKDKAHMILNSVRFH